MDLYPLIFWVIFAFGCLVGSLVTWRIMHGRREHEIDMRMNQRCFEHKAREREDINRLYYGKMREFNGQDCALAKGWVKK